MKHLRMLAPLSLLLISGSAFAHPGHGTDIASGLAHPFSGLDHMLAMVMVGVWAVQQREIAAFWKVPLAFVSAMLVGTVLGNQGMALPNVETGIALSVLVLGLLVAFAMRLPTSVAMGVVGLFALFHGYAHGAELPASATLPGFAVGFVLATAVLHGFGAFVGYTLSNRAQLLLRATGVGAATAGLWLVMA